MEAFPTTVGTIFVVPRTAKIFLRTARGFGNASVSVSHNVHPWLKVFCGRAFWRAGGRKLRYNLRSGTPYQYRLALSTFLFYERTIASSSSLSYFSWWCIRTWYGVVLLRVAEEQKKRKLGGMGRAKMRNSYCSKQWILQYSSYYAEKGLSGAMFEKRARVYVCSCPLPPQKGHPP